MADMSPKDRYEFKRQLEVIQGCRGRATELISLYVAPTRQISDVMGYLRNEYSQSSNIKSKSTKKNVMAAIDSIMNRLKQYKQPHPNGMCFFVGEVATGNNQTRMLQVTIIPPIPISIFLYRCDSTFFIEPLEGMLVDTLTFGLVVVDRSEATIGLLKGKRIIPIKNQQSLVPSKHGRGGQSARRFERLIEIAAHEFFTKVGEICNEAFMNEKDLRGILVGGPGATKDFFVKEGYLHHELQKKVVETFDTGYTNEFGLGELVEKASDTLANLELMKEKKVMTRFLDEIRKDDGGLAAYGEAQVRYALEVGAVSVLIVSEDLRRIRLSEQCNQCKTVRDRTITKPEDEGAPCDKCGGNVTLLNKVDLVEEFVKMCEAKSTDVEYVSTDSAEGDMLMKAFGGLAAVLRYKLVMPGAR